MLEGHPIANDVTLEPLDDYLVLEPLDETELPSGLIVPSNEATFVRTGIVAAVGGDAVMESFAAGFPRPHAAITPSVHARTTPRDLTTSPSAPEVQ